MPDGIVTLRIGPDSGTLEGTDSANGISEMFIADHLPSGQDATPGAQGQQGQASGEPIF